MRIAWLHCQRNPFRSDSSSLLFLPLVFSDHHILSFFHLDSIVHGPWIVALFSNRCACSKWLYRLRFLQQIQFYLSAVCHSMITENQQKARTNAIEAYDIIRFYPFQFDSCSRSVHLNFDRARLWLWVFELARLFKCANRCWKRNNWKWIYFFLDHNKSQYKLEINIGT